MSKRAGFTLIELAIAIAIVAILAAIAVPRLIDNGDQAELTVIQDFHGKLLHAYGNYTLRMRAIPPNGFTDFVTTGAIPTSSNFTMSMGNFGGGQCTIAAQTISCPATAFPRRNMPVQFQLQAGQIQAVY